MPLYRSGTFTFAARHTDLGKLAGEDPDPFTAAWPLWLNVVRLLPWLALMLAAALHRGLRLTLFLALLCVVAWLFGPNDATLAMLFAWSCFLLLSRRLLPLPRRRLTGYAAALLIVGSAACLVSFSALDVSLGGMLPLLLAAVVSLAGFYGAMTRASGGFGVWRFTWHAALSAFAAGAVLFNAYSAVVILQITGSVIYLVPTVVSTTILAAFAALAIAALLRAALADPEFRELVRQQAEQTPAPVPATTTAAG